MNEAERLAKLQILRDDFGVFAPEMLKILPKAGGNLVPFGLNKAQQYVHEKLEEQKRKTGKVRAIILKGRQQGMSTLVGGRFYWLSSMMRGEKAYIIAHEQAASDNLFGLVKRYHENNPLAPHTGTANAKELIFDRLDSGYKVATAGTKDVGRSATTQLAHLSEFAFWQNADLHLAGLGQTVSDMPGTEIIIESTANGTGNSFHQLWQGAESGENEYLAIFVPWFWQDEYSADVPEDFELSADDALYKRTYNLSLEQMAWRRNKIASFGKDREYLFDQEYPASAQKAFISATTDPFIRPDIAMAAVTSGYKSDDGPLIIGVDPAEFGPDRTVILFRRGRCVTRIETYQGKDTMETAGIVAKRINEFNPDAVFVDAVGIGAGVRDRLNELGFAVHGVKSGMRALDDKTYANKRAEMWGEMRAWLMDQPCRIPNHQELLSDLSAPMYRYDSSGRLLIEKKEDMKRRGLRSCDHSDALALTFAEPVRVHHEGVRTGASSYRPASSAGY
jgi:hypothetical protein